MSHQLLAQGSTEILAGLRGRQYQLIERVASGGFGAVYAARDMASGRRVAVKRLHTSFSPDPAIVARLEGEAHHVRELHHPNLVQFLDQGRDSQGVPFLVMDWVEGRTIAERMAQGRMRPEEVASIGCQVLDGLAAAHAKGVIHRDVKPNNLIVTSSGLVIAIDFGIAKTGSSTSSVPASSVLIGTPAYMAPEQLDGSQHIDGRVDLYALGVTLYEMLAAHTPFSGPQWADYIRQHLFETPPPLDQVRPDLDPRLVAVIMRALARHPADRFASAREMRAALAPCTVPSTGSAVSPGSSPNRAVAPVPHVPLESPDAELPVAPTDALTGEPRPLWLVTALTVATLGLYLPAWFGLSWSELKREAKDERMNPVGHGLAVAVPLYGLFRTHAHFRVLRQLRTRHTGAAGINPMVAVALMIGCGATSFLLPPLGLVIGAALVLLGQRALNAYWRVRDPKIRVRRPRLAEVFLLACTGPVVVLALGMFLRRV